MSPCCDVQYVALVYYFAHVNVDGPMVNKLCGHNENQCPFDSVKTADLSMVSVVPLSVRYICFVFSPESSNFNRFQAVTGRSSSFRCSIPRMKWRSIITICSAH